ncbi:MAG: type II toxin-antitoxin system RelE/ParE family toxin [Coriobacteriia bacterium]|nr:type II toxin-antitoxin system RelE/ParE family toxin [Coriobacteriia bacterium]MBS5478501.1 type II toxin-antitoxin system RelE/ParE family toxin [Coriobacteriia bacterium]
MIEVVFYEDTDGHQPVRVFLDALDAKMRAKVLGRIELLEELGAHLTMPYARHLGNGIYELRTVLGSNITRVLYFFMMGDRAVLTHGFVKKTQKTPRSELERAEQLRKDWMNRHDHV